METNSFSGDPTDMENNLKIIMAVQLTRVFRIEKIFDCSAATEWANRMIVRIKDTWETL